VRWCGSRSSVDRAMALRILPCHELGCPISPPPNSHLPVPQLGLDIAIFLVVYSVPG
jgi:hypothetical protein